MYDTGMGQCKLNDLLSCLDIPIMKPSRIKRYEDFLAGIIEECANDSFERAIEAEKAATIAVKTNEDVSIELMLSRLFVGIKYLVQKVSNNYKQFYIIIE